jgi:hypothetical protein
LLVEEEARVLSPWIENNMPSVKKESARNMIRVSRMVRAERIRTRQASAARREAAETIQKWNELASQMWSIAGLAMRTPSTISGTASATTAIRDGMSSLPLHRESRSGDVLRRLTLRAGAARNREVVSCQLLQI